MRRLSLLAAINNFIGRFNLTEFESELLSRFEQGLPQAALLIYLDQFARFNRVDRVIDEDERVDHGDTTFYWMKFGKSKINAFPKRFQCISDSEAMATCEVFSDENTIEVKFICVGGVMCILEYWSTKNIYYPTNTYHIGKLIYSDKLQQEQWK